MHPRSGAPEMESGPPHLPHCHRPELGSSSPLSLLRWWCEGVCRASFIFSSLVLLAWSRIVVLPHWMACRVFSRDACILTVVYAVLLVSRQNCHIHLLQLLQTSLKENNFRQHFDQMPHFHWMWVPTGRRTPLPLRRTR